MSLSYCGNLARQQDPDRFLLSLLTPRRARPALWALYAFNYEIAKTREVVSEAMLGLIRLTWWREAIGEIYAGGAVRQHEVVQALADTIRTYNLPQDKFETLIDAREFDVGDRSPATLEELFQYADQTTSPLTELSLKIMGEEEDARDVSVRYAVTGLLRAAPYMMSQRRCYLPDDIMAAHNLSTQKIFDFDQRAALPAVVKDVVNALPVNAKVTGKYLRAMNKLTDLYLAQIERAGFDLFHLELVKPPAFKALRLLLT